MIGRSSNDFGASPKSATGGESPVVRVGQYQLCVENGKFAILGKGGFGTSYLATHVYLGTKAALKVIHDAFSDDENVKKRFFLEAKSLAELRHPNIARILDFGEDDGRLYYAMEFGDGGDLEKHVRQKGALPLLTALCYIRDAAGALAHVHSKGLLHRDLKPANFILCTDHARGSDMEIKVIDFGLVKRLGVDAHLGLTRTGETLMSLLYASPEQLQNEPLDVRSDVFSLGLTLWFMITDTPLFVNEEPTKIALFRVREGASYDSRLPQGLPLQMKSLLSDMLNFQLSERIASMDEVVARADACILEMTVTPASGHRVSVAQNQMPLEDRFQCIAKLEGFATPVYEVIDQTNGDQCTMRRFPLTELGEVDHASRLLRLANWLDLQRPPFFFSAAELVKFSDGFAWIEKAGRLTLKSLVAAKQGMPMGDALPLLSQIALAADIADKNPDVGLKLLADNVFIEFPVSKLATFQDRSPTDVPMSQWPPCLMRLRLDFQWSQEEPPHPMSDATVEWGKEQLATATPAQNFAALIYYTLAARPPGLGSQANRNLPPIPSLSEAGNDLIRDVLVGQFNFASCSALWHTLLAIEGHLDPGCQHIAEITDWAACTSRGTHCDVLPPMNEDATPPVNHQAATSTAKASTSQYEQPVTRKTWPPVHPPVEPAPDPEFPIATPPTEIVPATEEITEKAHETTDEEITDLVTTPPISDFAVDTSELVATQPSSPLQTFPVSAVRGPESPVNEAETFDRFVAHLPPWRSSPQQPSLNATRKPSAQRTPLHQSSRTIMISVVAAVLAIIGIGLLVMGHRPRDTRPATQAKIVKSAPHESASTVVQSAPLPITVVQSRPPSIKIAVVGTTEPASPTIILGGKPLEAWHGQLPAETHFPLNLSASASGYLPYEVQCSPEAGSGSLIISPFKLMRASGTILIPLPAHDLDFKLATFNWVGPLDDEKTAPAPTTTHSLPLAAKAGGTPSPSVSLPTGQYHARLSGSEPQIEPFELPDLLIVKAGVTIAVANLPASLAGTYVCEYPMGEPPKQFRVRREISLRPELASGTLKEIIVSGPGGKVNGKDIVYPITNTFKLDHLISTAVTGISGTVLKKAAGGLANEKFHISKGEIRIEPETKQFAPFSAAIIHEPLVGP